MNTFEVRMVVPDDFLRDAKRIRDRVIDEDGFHVYHTLETDDGVQVLSQENAVEPWEIMALAMRIGLDAMLEDDVVDLSKIRGAFSGSMSSPRDITRPESRPKVIKSNTGHPGTRKGARRAAPLEGVNDWVLNLKKRSQECEAEKLAEGEAEATLKSVIQGHTL